MPETKLSNVVRVGTKRAVMTTGHVPRTPKHKRKTIGQLSADPEYFERLARTTQTHVAKPLKRGSYRVPGHLKPIWASEVTTRLTDGTIIEIAPPYSKRRLAVIIKTREPIPKSLRMKVIRRDHGLCRYCGCEPYEIQLDHVVPFSIGGPTTYDNLVTACVPCNQKKKARTWTPKPIGYHK